MTGPENMYYVSGYRAVLASGISPLMAAVIPAKREPRLITRSLEVRAANQMCLKKPVLFMGHADPYKPLAEILTESGATASGVIGIEEGNITVWRFNKMKQAMGKARFMDASRIVKGVMARPSKTEVAYMRKATALANIGFQREIEAIRKGVYSYEVIGEIHHAFYKAGQTDNNVSQV